MSQFIVKRRKRMDYIQFTCRIEEELMTKLKDIVFENNLDSVNGFINDCLRFALDNIKIEDGSKS